MTNGFEETTRGTQRNEFCGSVGHLVRHQAGLTPFAWRAGGVCGRTLRASGCRLRWGRLRRDVGRLWRNGRSNVGLRGCRSDRLGRRWRGFAFRYGLGSHRYDLRDLRHFRYGLGSHRYDLRDLRHFRYGLGSHRYDLRDLRHFGHRYHLGFCSFRLNCLAKALKSLASAVVITFITPVGETSERIVHRSQEIIGETGRSGSRPGRGAQRDRRSPGAPQIHPE